MDALARQALATSLAGGTKPVLRRGSEGDEVVELQTFLAQRGYPVGLVDGVFGRQTERALKAFQSESGLSPDGRAGTQTYAAIEQAEAPSPMPRMQDDYLAMTGDAGVAGSEMAPDDPGIMPNDAMMADPMLAGSEMASGGRFPDETFTEATPDLGERYQQTGSQGLAEAIDRTRSGLTGQPYENIAASRRMNTPEAWTPQPGDGLDPLRAALLAKIQGRNSPAMAAGGMPNSVSIDDIMRMIGSRQ